MQVCLIKEGIDSGVKRLEEWLGENKTERVDLYAFGFAQKEVSYEKELKGESDFFESVAQFSKKTGSVVVCGCITDTQGHKRCSAVVAENGRLLGVSDATRAVDDNLGVGACLRVYETKKGKIGVVVNTDFYFQETLQTLVACGADYIVCPFLGGDELIETLVKASAFFNGIPILFCADTCWAVQSSGEVLAGGKEKMYALSLCIGKEYHLIQTRKRGICSCANKGNKQ